MFLLFHGQDEVKETFAGGALMHLSDGADHLTGKPVDSVESKGQVEVMAVERGGGRLHPSPGATFQQGTSPTFVVARRPSGRWIPCSSRWRSRRPPCAWW